MDQALQNSAHFVLWFDASHRVVDANIDSDESPTVTPSRRHLRALVVRKVSGRGIGFEEAERRLINMIKNDHALAPMLTMPTMQIQVRSMRRLAKDRVVGAVWR